MHKHFGFNLGALLKQFQFVERKLAGKHNTLETNMLTMICANRVVVGHLCACMSHKFRKIPPHKAENAPILNDYASNWLLRQKLQRIENIGQLIVFHHNI